MNRIFGIASSALAAQTVRLNTIASNVANANTVAGSPEAVYRARSPVFSAVLERAASPEDVDTASVRVTGVYQHEKPPVIQYRPDHPLADENGNIFAPDIEVMTQYADLIAASRSYETNVEIIDTTRQLMLKTLQLGR
jgi:flagellar basal-body rod protein FlgC